MLVKCQLCGFTAIIEHFDALNSCPGNLFCPHCCTEIDVLGRPQELCGTCDLCLNLKRLGLFDLISRKRNACTAIPRSKSIH